MECQCAPHTCADQYNFAGVMTTYLSGLMLGFALIIPIGRLVLFAGVLALEFAHSV